MEPNTSRYVLQIIVCLTVVTGVLLWRTNGFVHYTYESVRRAQVENTPVILSDWQLQSAQGKPISMSAFDDNLLLVNFIFTRCPTICQAQGTRYQQLQDEIEAKNVDGVLLLSISIDPHYDTPKRLQYYRTAHRGDAANWLLARPIDSRQLDTIVEETGLRIIANSIGGYSHSESIHLVRNGKLIAIRNWDSVSLEALISNATST